MVSHIKIAVILGLVALCSGGVLVRTRTMPVPIKSYGQQLAPMKFSHPAPVVLAKEEPKPVEPEVEEEEEEVEEVPETHTQLTQYRPAVRTSVAAPIRVSTRLPERDSVAPVSQSARLENERMAQEQNKNAQYSFGSAIDDGINDMSQVRQETRDGLKVEGSYSYSDGYNKHTVKYVADENGYRVIENLKEEIGDGSGPVVDPVNGKVDVHTNNQGVEMTYSVSAKELEDLKKQQQKVAAETRSKSKTSKTDEYDSGY